MTLVIKDSNYEDRKVYANLCDRLSHEPEALQDKRIRLKWGYNLLKGYYNSLVEENSQFVAKRKEVRQAFGSVTI